MPKKTVSVLNSRFRIAESVFFFEGMFAGSDLAHRGI